MGAIIEVEPDVEQEHGMSIVNFSAYDENDEKCRDISSIVRIGGAPS